MSPPPRISESRIPQALESCRSRRAATLMALARSAPIISAPCPEVKPETVSRYVFSAGAASWQNFAWNLQPRTAEAE